MSFEGNEAIKEACAKKMLFEDHVSFEGNEA